MQKPLYYEAADGWKTLLKAAYFPSILIIVILACAFWYQVSFPMNLNIKLIVYFCCKAGTKQSYNVKDICRDKYNYSSLLV